MPLLLPLLGKHGLWVCETQIGAAHSELLCMCVCTYILRANPPQVPGPSRCQQQASVWVWCEESCVNFRLAVFTHLISTAL